MPTRSFLLLFLFIKLKNFCPIVWESVINQSYQNLEIVCVNDGSPDRCGEIFR